VCVCAAKPDFKTRHTFFVVVNKSNVKHDNYSVLNLEIMLAGRHLKDKFLSDRVSALHRHLNVFYREGCFYNNGYLPER
jgi:hypothetical protein